MTEQRRLAAILVADVVGYSTLVGKDEAGTLARLNALRSDIVDPAIARHSGRLFKAMGDGFLVEFASAVQAVSCAKAIQDGNTNSGLHLRIGIHLGDVVVQGDDLLGDGVNIAARVEGVAEPGGIAISRQVHDQVRDKLDLKFVDKGQVELKNLVRPVRVFALGGAKEAEAPVLALPDKPSIAVLPFQNMSGDADQEYFVDGLVEDIITALSRFKSLFVIARNSSFTYKGRAVDIKQVGRELGVRYVLEGSVRKAGSRVRITGQLIDAVSGAHVWANSFDRDLVDIFALQDEATQSVVSAVEPNLRFAEIARKTNVPTQHLNAYDLYLRALAKFDAFTREGLAAAEDLLRRAVEIDPNYSDAWTLLAQTLFHEVIGGWRAAPDAVEEAKQAALTATKVDPENGVAHAVAGTYPIFWGGSVDVAVEMSRRALALHPNSEVVRNSAGWALLFSGELDAALGHLETGLRIAPFGRSVGVMLHGMALVKFFQRNFDDAANHVSRASEKMPENPNVWRVKAAALAHAGRIDEARAAVRQLLLRAPKASISAARSHFRHQWMRDLYIDGLRKAGLPEGETAPSSLALPDKPSIAVLPFQNLSGDPEQEYFADGIVEDITTALSRFKSLFVIARNSSFTYKGKVVDIKQVGRELGVRYVLEGSVRKAGGRVRITGQLIDSQTGAHLWANHFDGTLEDIFELQDQVTGRLVAAIAPRVTEAEIERARRKPVESIDAYDCFLRGSALFEQRTREAHEQASKLFERATELDPTFSTPYAMILRTHSTAKLHGWSSDPKHAESEVRRLAKIVSALGADDALALSSAGFGLTWVCRDYEAGAAFVDRALVVNPNLVHAWMNRAMISTFSGEHGRAIQEFERARRISPIGPDYYLVQGYLGYCHFLLGQYQDAIRVGAESASHQPNWLSGHVILAAAYGMTGNVEQARKSVEQVRRISPNFSPATVETIWSFRRPEDIARLAEGLRLAGLPEEAPTAALALPDKPSIAVLPFQNMSGDPEQEYFVDGLVEDIITALSRFKSLFVIARNSSFTYKGKAVDIKQVGRELGVRYVLEGSVRKAGGRVRITGQLIEAATGAHLWADRFDGALEDVFELQDRVAVSVVGAIAPKLQKAEFERARRKPIESLDAYDLVLRGLALRAERTNEAEDEAQRLFYAAIERDPGFATPYGLAAGGYILRQAVGRVEDKAGAEAEVRRLTARVALIGADDSLALSVAGGALLYVCRDYDSGAAMMDQALAINPNDAFALRFRGWAHIFMGQHDKALESFARVLRLSPLDPRLGEAQRGMAAALTFLGRYEEATAWAEKALANDANDAATLRVVAVACAMAGKVEEARKVAVRLCRLLPALRVSRLRDYIPHRREQDIALFAEGLRRAGVPE